MWIFFFLGTRNSTLGTLSFKILILIYDGLYKLDAGTAIKEFADIPISSLAAGKSVISNRWHERPQSSSSANCFKEVQT